MSAKKMHQLRRMIKQLPCFILPCVLSFNLYAQKAAVSGTSGFVHPGALQSAADLERIKQNVANGIEPWAAAWKVFRDNKWIVKTYQPRPLAVAGRGVGSVGQDNISNDATAAYYNAIAWYVSGDEEYARKTIAILNAWSYQLKLINGKDAVLCAGIYGYKFANAAEIIRYTYKGWSNKDVEQCKHMLTDVFYPVIKDFSPYANGNWDAACLPTMMSIGVFCDDRIMFDRAVKYYFDGSGDGSLMHYIINEDGQAQESGRDQPHTGGGIGHLASAAEIGYTQGLDMYGAFNNRLLKGFEYTTKYNLGNDVPFEPTHDRTGKYNHTAISPGGRGRAIPNFEMIFNHYQNRMGIPAPFTAQDVAKYRPESFAIDHPGAGTLLFALPPFKSSLHLTNFPPVAPAALIAKSYHKVNKLCWIAPLNAESYIVKRAVKSGGPYIIIAKNIKETSYTDVKTAAGKLYYYVVSAQNAKCEGQNSLETGICTNMPERWAYAVIGSTDVAGFTNYNGKVFTLEGGGNGIGAAQDEFQYAYLPLTGNGTMVARFVPPVASQFAKMGLMVREALTPDAANAALLFMPAPANDIEVPVWNINLLVRSAAGAESKIMSHNQPLADPFVTWGRLMEPYWLKLTRDGNTFTSYISPDGEAWSMIGQTEVSMKEMVYIGLAASSCIKVSTTVNFDHIAVTGWSNVNER